MKAVRCPVCGAFGELWHKNPDVFVCNNCLSFYSRFGVLFDVEKETEDMETCS